METALEQEIEGFRHTSRYSPGYCGWHLSEQRKLFRLLGDSPCGIELSDVCLMKPIKSISGIIGVGRNVKEKQYGCRYCEMETCYRKRIKN
jgi:cobalamin-dependent methionine synthase I